MTTKKVNGNKGKKKSPEHIAKIMEGRRKFYEAKKASKGILEKSNVDDEKTKISTDEPENNLTKKKRTKSKSAYKKKDHMLNWGYADINIDGLCVTEVDITDFKLPSPVVRIQPSIDILELLDELDSCRSE